MTEQSIFWLEHANTECDSSEQREEEHHFGKTNPKKHKTELCKTFSEMGFCRYGNNCKFAHGKSELISLPLNHSRRSRKCKGFWGKNICCYGSRCQFGHSLAEKDSQRNNFLKLAKHLLLPITNTHAGSRLVGNFSPE